MMNEQELKRRIEEAAAALKVAGAEAVYLFGSVAEGRRRADSDVDLAVSGLEPERFVRAMSRAAEILQCPLDLVDLDEETPFVRYVKRKGRLQRVA
jgi:predicted nucleotidyltransferase